MLFTYEMKIPVGNGKTISKEIDGELTVERNGDWSIALLCEDSGEYEPVHNETDLYGDICEFLHTKHLYEVHDAIRSAQRSFRYSDQEQARQ